MSDEGTPRHTSRSRNGGARAAIALQLALATWLACSAEVAPSPQDDNGVRIVERAEFDEMRASGKYVISESRGEVTASAACSSSGVDDRCVATARQRLRDAARERGANLVLVLDASVLQSQPPQYVLTGELYEVRSR